LKDAIMREAALEIMQRGLKFSIRELAARTGISTKTLYQHFASKEELVTSLVERAVVQMKEREREVLADESLPAVTKLYETLAILPRGFAFADVRILRELRSLYPKAWLVLDEYFNEGWDNIRVLIDRGFEQGALRPFDVDTFIHAYVGAIYRMMDFEAFGQRGIAMEKALGDTVDLLMNGIVAGDGKEVRL